MIELLRSPWYDHFERLLTGASRSLVIASPYVSSGPCRQLARRSQSAPVPAVLLLTDLSPRTLLSGATDAAALAEVALSYPDAEVRFLPSIHAKVYVADEREAIVSSSNMTSAGLYSNWEYGVRLTAPTVVRQIRKDITDYAALGTQVGPEKLRMMAELAADLRDTRRKADRSAGRRLQAALRDGMEHLELQALRVRAAGRTPHAIFADAILYLLSRRPMRTRELHPLVQSIHPDMCDDTVDRVIDGVRFGKKWKHAVRTAQQHLRRRGVIELEGGVWRLTSEVQQVR